MGKDGLTLGGGRSAACDSERGGQVARKRERVVKEAGES